MSLTTWLWITVRAAAFGFLAWLIWKSVNDDAFQPAQQQRPEVGVIIGGIVAMLFAGGLGYRAGRDDAKTEISKTSA